MKFGNVILRQHLYQKIIKHLMTSLLWRSDHVIFYFRLGSGKKVEIPNFFVFYPICLKFGMGGGGGGGGYSTWSCYWLDQFLTLALNTLILSIFFHWICLPSILLILVGVELPLCVVVTLSQNVVLCFLESS